MPNRDPYDPYRDDAQSQDRAQRRDRDGGDYGWRTGGENRSFGGDDSRSGYGQYAREPRYGGQGAYGQGQTSGGYGFGSQSQAGDRYGENDYARGGQGGLGPSEGGYGAGDWGGSRRIHQGEPTYARDEQYRTAQRSRSRQDQYEGGSFSTGEAYASGHGPAARREYGRYAGDENQRGEHSDPHYQRWHDEQMQSHDRDYARWREERSKQYHAEYGNWRDQRHQAFSKDFDDWRTRQGQKAVRDVTDGGDGSPDRDEND
jgi:hypothetical protein